LQFNVLLPAGMVWLLSLIHQRCPCLRSASFCDLKLQDEKNDYIIFV